MRSWQVLTVHCLLFWLLMASALSSPIINAYDPAFFTRTFFPIYSVCALITMIGWSPGLGGCSLTRLENRLRIREGKPPYSKTFLVHYIGVVTGVAPNKSVVTAILVATMFLPVLVVVYEWFP